MVWEDSNSRSSSSSLGNLGRPTGNCEIWKSDDKFSTEFSNFDWHSSTERKEEEIRAGMGAMAGIAMWGPGYYSVSHGWMCRLLPSLLRCEDLIHTRLQTSCPRFRTTATETATDGFEGTVRHHRPPAVIHVAPTVDITQYRELSAESLVTAYGSSAVASSKKMYIPRSPYDETNRASYL